MEKNLHQPTVKWAYQSCIPIGPELDVIIQGGDNAPNQSLSPSDDDDGGGGCVLDQ